MAETVLTQYIHLKALDLLNKLANSIHDRESPNLNQFFFSTEEIKVCEAWVKNLLIDYELDLTMLVE